jgi:hypothetical protein
MASPAAIKYSVWGAMLKPTMSPSIVLARRSLSTGARSRPKTLRNGFNSIVLPCSSTFFSLFGAKASKSISSTSITNYTAPKTSTACPRSVLMSARVRVVGH